MDFTVAAIFFAIGLGGALLASNLSKWRRGGKGTEDLPMKDGSVRMDRMVARGSSSGRGEGPVSGPAEAAESVAPRVGDTARSGKVRPRRRKRR